MYQGSPPDSIVVCASPALDAMVATSTPRMIPSEPIVRTVMVIAPEIPVLDFEEANLSDDEVFFEVGWPSPTEGDL